MSKIVVLGLDGLNPELVKRFSDELPNLKKMQQEGIWGDIESIVPATTPQVWTCSSVWSEPRCLWVLGLHLQG